MGTGASGIVILWSVVIWGILPIYWNALNPISSLVVIFYRITLMTLTCFAIQYYRTRNIKALFAPMFENKRKLWTYIVAGIASAIPMGLFSAAAKNLPLLTLGLTEYISPSIALVLGIFLFMEPFDTIQFSAFVIICIGRFQQQLMQRELWGRYILKGNEEYAHGNISQEKAGIQGI